MSNILIGGFSNNSEAISMARKLKLVPGTYKIVRDRDGTVNIVEAK
jgi:hypothetical protein